MKTRLSGGVVEFEVLHPDDPSIVLWCHPCVLSVECPHHHCQSKIGVPCVGAQGYKQSTHYLRRDLYKLAKRHDFQIPIDVLAAAEARWGVKVSPTTVAPPDPPVRSEFIQTFPHVKLQSRRQRKR